MSDYKKISDFNLDCSDVLRQFFNYLSSIKNYSPRTIKVYYGNLKEFFGFFLTEKLKFDINEKQNPLHFASFENIKQVETEDIIEYLTFLRLEHNNSEATRNNKLSALKTLFNWLCIKEKKLEVNPAFPVDTAKIEKKQPKYLTQDQAVKLLQSVDTSFTSRDYCIIVLFLNTGMRLSELVGLNKSDIRNDNTVRILGKGNKERILFLNAMCLKALEIYLEERNQIPYIKEYDALFISKQHKKRLTTRRVQDIIKECLTKAGLENYGFSTHKLRHTSATLMYQSGTDVRALQAILGHENLSTTQIYTHINNEQIKKALDNNPLNTINREDFE